MEKMGGPHGRDDHILGRLTTMDKWYKNNKGDKIWWLDMPDTIGEWIFSFDKKTKFSMYPDYPDKLTPEQKEIFDRENPIMKELIGG